MGLGVRNKLVAALLGVLFLSGCAVKVNSTAVTNHGRSLDSVLILWDESLVTARFPHLAKKMAFVQNQLEVDLKGKQVKTSLHKSDSLTLNLDSTIKEMASKGSINYALRITSVSASKRPASCCVEYFKLKFTLTDAHTKKELWNSLLSGNFYSEPTEISSSVILDLEKNQFFSK